jgi:hypothetical protein
MSSPIHKNEIAWRGYMLMGQFSVRNAVFSVRSAIYGALLIYLISTYSVPVAIIFSALALLTSLWFEVDRVRFVRSRIAEYEADPEMDL